MREVNENLVRYAVVTPVRDEEEHLEGTIQSVTAQTVKPAEWVIVDDGSVDGTAAIIDRYAAQYSWIRGLHRGNRGFRKRGGGVVEAFNDGYQALQCRDWEFVVKLDGDLTFGPDYFENIFKRFLAEPRLGVAGGTLCSLSDGTMKVERNPRFHVRGATKVYRRECWEDIGGFFPAPGWDTLDETSASMKGWTTMSIPEVTAVHHRPTGATEGAWADSLKRGLIWYTVGYHPLFVLASCLNRLVQKPYVVRSVGGLCGFFRAYWSHVPRISNPALVRFIRQEQMKRLMGRETIWR